MYESKRFALEYEDYNENGKTPADLLKNIMEDTQFGRNCDWAVGRMLG